MKFVLIFSHAESSSSSTSSENLSFVQHFISWHDTSETNDPIPLKSAVGIHGMQKINHNDLGYPMTFFSSATVTLKSNFSLYTYKSEQWSMMGRIAEYVHGPQRIHPLNVNDLLTLPLVLPPQKTIYT